MPTTVERGYGQAHRRERAKLKPIVERGEAYCAETICLFDSRWIEPGTRWDLAHVPDRSEYHGPAHMKCNRSEGARRGNKMRSAPPATPRRSREW